MSETEHIVRALAETDEPIDPSWQQCIMCEADNTWDDDTLERACLHEPSCPWRMAREWVAARDAGSSPARRTGVDCSACGASVADCDDAIGRRGRGCCATCYRTDTHQLPT